MAPLPVAVLYVQKDTASTQQISNFLGHHITDINQRYFVQRVYVTERNVTAVKAKGIRQTPCLFVNGRLAFGPQKIIELLTPPRREQDNFGLGSASPEELVNSYQEALIAAPKEEDEDDSEADRTEEIRRRMSEFQRQRPEMAGVDKRHKIPGGKQLRAKKVAQVEFKSDEEFARATRVDNVEPTPVAPFLSDADGEALLEEYRNETADMYMPDRRSKNSRKPRRRMAL